MKNKNHVVFGLSGAIIMIVIFLIQWFSQMPADTPLMKWLVTIVFAAVVIFGCLHYSKINNAQVTFGEVFGNGFKITSVIVLAFLVFYVAFVLIFPEYKDRMIEEGMKKIPPGTNPEDVKKGMEMMSKNFIIFSISGIILMDLLLGLLASLLGAAFAKKTTIR